MERAFIQEVQQDSRVIQVYVLKTILKQERPDLQVIMIGNIRNGVRRGKVELSVCPGKNALMREGEGKVQMVRPFPAFLQSCFIQMQRSDYSKIRAQADRPIRQQLTVVRDFEGGDHGNILMGRSIILGVESITSPFRQDIVIIGVGRHA